MRQFDAPLFHRAAGRLRAAAAVCAASLAALSVAAASIHAQDGTTISGYGKAVPADFSSWIARNFVVVAGADPNDPLYATMKGTGYDGVAALFVQRTDGNFLCTGALLAGTQNVLTAAHCLADETGTNITLGVTAVFFPPNQPATTREFVTSSSTHVNPMYTGEVIDAHDIAIVSLSAAPSASVASSGYKLFQGNPFQTAQFVGSGTTGTGAVGGTPGSGGFTLGDRRRALNTIDFTWTDPEWGGFWDGFFGPQDPTTLVADFDNGTSANNTSCILTVYVGWTSPTCGLGQGINEGMLGPGDSGGPLFINGQIAGVASYGLSFGKSFGDQDNLLNSSFGELGGWTSTEYNEAWLTPYATTVPEPGSFALVGVGLFALVGVVKRRTTRS